MSMYPKNMFFTSESVTEGHPDKFCDLISDTVLDECLKRDPMARVAWETYITMGLVNVGGEITTKALFDYELLPYHRFGLGKYELLGEVYELDDYKTPSADLIAHLQAIIDEAFGRSGPQTK